jgi:GTP-binding protein Era
METKISIVSNKPQTTRKQILGIKTNPEGQIVFFDSPGIHKPHFRLNEKMMKDVHASLLDADIILYFIEIEDIREDEFAISLFRDLDKSVFLVINKIDKFNKAKILGQIDHFKDLHRWNEIVPISAKEGHNMDLIEELLYKYLPEGDYLYPDEEYTLQTEKFYAAELVREKILQTSKDEIPFTTTVKVEEINKKENIVYVRAEIYVETPSQKKILIGKKGHFVKTIGARARKDLEDYYEKKVYLDLFVKVVPDWRNSIHILNEIEA